jgi:hypothetical protein
VRKMLLGIGLVAVVALALRGDSSLARRRALVRRIEGEMLSPDPEKYWADVLDDEEPHPSAWCGALILWAHRAEGLSDAHWVRGQGIATPLRMKIIPSSQVKIGDVAYFTRFQHVATVSRVLGGNRFEILNGNAVGGAITRTVTDASKVAAFYSISHLVGG